jgi:hypothetical protein
MITHKHLLLSPHKIQLPLLFSIIGSILILELMGMNCLDVRALYHRQTAVNVSLKKFKNITANSFVSKAVNVGKSLVATIVADVKATVASIAPVSVVYAA